MKRVWWLIRGATPADILVLLATLTLIAALLYPRWSARTFHQRVAGAVGDVDALIAAARANRDLQGRWPTPTAPGEPPPELSGLAGPEGPFSRAEYALSWATWEVVDSVEAAADPGPPPAPDDAPRETARPRMLPVTRAVGAVSVHSPEEALLAELLEHYGAPTSLVVDTIWLLLLPERAPVRAPSP